MTPLALEDAGSAGPPCVVSEVIWSHHSWVIYPTKLVSVLPPQRWGGDVSALIGFSPDTTPTSAHTYRTALQAASVSHLGLDFSANPSLQRSRSHS